MAPSANTPARPTIYIPSDSGHDFSRAARFGTLCTMSRGTIDKYNLTEMIRTFEPHLAGSTEADFILQSGPTVMCSMACAMFAARHRALNLLLWRVEQDGDDRYIHRRVVFPAPPQ